MTNAQFQQSVTDEISVRLLDAQGREQSEQTAFVPDDVPPHIVRIPMRVEYRAMLDAAAAYEAHASRLLKLAWEAREQAANLKAVAGL